MHQQNWRCKPIVSVITLSLMVLSGCARDSNILSAQPSINRDDLLSGHALFNVSETDLSLPDADVLKLDDKMKNYLKYYIPENDSKTQKFHQLVTLLFSSGNLGISYDPTQTHTAASTFTAGSGNCLGVSYLFTSMANELGIETYFQNVAIPPVWGIDNDIVYKYRHVNVVVKLPHQRSYVIDVNINNNLPQYDSTRVSKKNAVAQYYSNKGAEFLAKKDMVNAFRYFKKAIYVDPRQAEFWSNLGVLYSKSKKYDYAESAYLTALGYQNNNLTAISNIASLYNKTGQYDLGMKYRALAEVANSKNPYLRYIKAIKRFESGDYEKSLSHIKWAIKKEKDEPKFYTLLAQIYEKTGEIEKAIETKEKGKNLAEELQRTLKNKNLRIKYFAKDQSGWMRQ